MTKNEICDKLVFVCNTLNNITVTGIQNAGNICGCHSIVQEVIQVLLSCEIVSPEDKRGIAKSSPSQIEQTSARSK